MNTALNLQKFLKRSLIKHRITRKDLIIGTGLSAATISKITNAALPNPNIITILKIALFFQCSVDEILARKKYIRFPNIQKTCVHLSLTEINSNLLCFLNKILQQLNISAYTLEKNCKLGSSTIAHFIKTKENTRILSTSAIVRLADYFNISIDEMIGYK